MRKEERNQNRTKKGREDSAIVRFGNAHGNTMISSGDS